MVDLEDYHGGSTWKPDLIDDNDCRNWVSDCQCFVCKDRRKVAKEGRYHLFADYGFITPIQRDELTRHQYLLCPFEIPAFVFRTRNWGKQDQDLCKVSCYTLY